MVTAAGWGILLCVVATAGCQFDTSGVAALDGAADAPVADASGVKPDAPGVKPDAPGVKPDAPGVKPDAPGVMPDAPPDYVRTITIDGNKVSGTLTDFPVYIEIDGDNHMKMHASSSGDDINFTDAQGGALDYEIQHWDHAAGDLKAWVRIPSLVAGTDLSIELHYGGGSTGSPNPAGVWKNGFVAVWHMEEAPTAQGAVRDSLGTYNATGSSSMDASNLVPSVLGNGLSFDGGSDELTFQNPLPGASPHTISAWVDQQTSSDNDALMVLGTGTCEQSRWFHTRFTGGPLAVGFYCDDFTDTKTDIQGKGPTLVHWTYDAAHKSRIYVGGKLVAGPFTHSGNQSTMGNTGHIGNAPAAFGTNMGLHGTVDEVHVANVARSSAWIATEYANQSAPTAFITVGAPQIQP